jgi:hypothetical protein
MGNRAAMNIGLESASQAGVTLDQIGYKNSQYLTVSH